MRTSYFRRMAGQSYRRARSVSKRHIDYEALIRRGHEFNAEATTAVVPLICERRRFGKPSRTGGPISGQRRVVAFAAFSRDHNETLRPCRRAPRRNCYGRRKYGSRTAGFGARTDLTGSHCPYGRSGTKISGPTTGNIHETPHVGRSDTAAYAEQFIHHVVRLRDRERRG